MNLDFLTGEPPEMAGGAQGFLESAERGEAVASFDRRDFRKLFRRTDLRWREPGG